MPGGRFGTTLTACSLAPTGWWRRFDRLMPNLGGPGGRRRRLYAGVVHSVMMYDAPVWAREVVKNRKIGERMWAVQRRIALRVMISAYRTVSGRRHPGGPHPGRYSDGLLSSYLFCPP